MKEGRNIKSSAVSSFFNNCLTTRLISLPRWVVALSFIICHLSFSPTGAHAQNTKVRFGIKGGININEFSFSGDDFKKDNRAGFFVGPTLTFGLPVIGLGAEICGLYDYRTVKINGESIDQKTLDVPLNVHYTVGFSETACAFLAAGPQFSFALDDDVFSFTDNTLGEVNWQLNDTALSFNVGGGFIINHLQIGVSYNIPISKTCDFDWSDATEKVFHAHSKSKGWQLSAAYFF